LIKLTKSNNGKEVFVAPELIIAIEDVDGATRLDIPHSLCFVSESPEEVARKVLEYKKGLIDYHHDKYAAKASLMLYQLAGLEESQ